MHAYLQAVVTVLSLINPAVCVMIFARGESGRTRAERRIDATRAAAAVLSILVLAALLGTRILELFGLSLDAFMVAGGVVLGWMGFSMLASRPSTTPEKDGDSGSLTPLILFAASPGTITGVITVSAAHSPRGLPETALVAVVAGAFLLWLVLLLAVRLGGKAHKPSLFSETSSRFMGLIVLAMGVQFGLQGFRSFMGHGG